MALRQFSYLPHDGMPGVALPFLFWDDVTQSICLDFSLIVGSRDFPKFTFPPYDIFDHPKLYVERLVESASAPIPGYGNRAMFFRLIMNPPDDTLERGWGMQGSADVYAGCEADFDCGVPGHPDLMGVEGTVVHEGSGYVGLAAGLMGYVSIGGAGVDSHIGEAISSYGFQPQAGHASSLIDKAYCFKAKVRPGPGTVTKKFSFVSEDGCGNGGIGYDEPEAAWAVKDGISAGRNEDPGTGYVHAEAGFSTHDGVNVVQGASGSFTSADGKTITVVNGIITSIVAP